MNVSPAVVWGVIGIVLITLEIFTSSFFIIFFGVSSLIVAIACFLGLDSRVTEIFLAATLGVAGLLVFRKKLVLGIGGSQGDALPKQRVRLTTAIPAKSFAQIEHQGTTWTAFNDTDENFSPGETAVVDRMDGVKMILGRESK